MSLLYVFLFAVLAAIGFFVLYGRENTWELIAGPADLGPVAFETLERSKSPNDALIAPRGLGRATVDAEPPVFAAPREALRDAVAALMAAEPLATRVAGDADAFEARWVVRTPLMRYPDTVSIHILEIKEGRSTLALHSRSRIGHSDLGANRARLERYLARLSTVLPTVP